MALRTTAITITKSIEEVDNDDIYGPIIIIFFIYIYICDHWTGYKDRIGSRLASMFDCVTVDTGARIYTYIKRYKSIRSNEPYS